MQARVEAKQIAKFNKERHKSVEGLGQKIATIPGTAYHFWGQKLGYGCWNDKAFMDAKVTTARFYADHLLSRAPGVRDSIVDGAKCVTELSLEAF